MEYVNAISPFVGYWVYMLLAQALLYFLIVAWRVRSGPSRDTLFAALGALTTYHSSARFEDAVMGGTLLFISGLLAYSVSLDAMQALKSTKTLRPKA